METEKTKINGKLILYIITTAIVFGLVGFYVGRHYERSAIRENMTIKQRTRPNGGQNVDPMYERITPPPEETPPSIN